MTHSLFCFASLVSEHSDEDELYLMAGSKTSHVTGSVVSSLFHLKDQSCFVFPDLSVRTEGRWRFKMSMYEIVEDGVHFVKSLFTTPFQCYSSKRFPGMSESTELSKSFASQGLRLRIRRNNRPGDDDDEEDDNPRPRKKQSMDQIIPRRRSSAAELPPPPINSSRRISHPPANHQHSSIPQSRSFSDHPRERFHHEDERRHVIHHAPPPPQPQHPPPHHYERAYSSAAAAYGGWPAHYPPGGGLGVTFGSGPPPPHQAAHRLPPPPAGFGQRSYPRSGFNYQHPYQQSPPAPYEQFARSSGGPQHSLPPPSIAQRHPHSYPHPQPPNSPPRLAPIRATSTVSSSHMSETSQSSTSQHRPASSTPTSSTFCQTHLPTPNLNTSPRGEGWERERDRVRERERERRMSGEGEGLDGGQRSVRTNESSVRGGESADEDRRAEPSQEQPKPKSSLAMLLGQESRSAKEAYSAPDFL